MSWTDRGIRTDPLQYVDGCMSMQGKCANAAGSKTAITIPDLAGYGDDFFNSKYYMHVLKNANSAGNAPDGEYCLITDYVSATGVFTVTGTGFSANVETGDEVIIIHASVYSAYTSSGYTDHLYAVADGGSHAYPDSVVQESILAYLMSKSTNPVVTSFNNTTDSLEMLSDKFGAFTGDGGVAQDDSVKASLDLAHTDLDAALVLVDSKVAGREQIFVKEVTSAADAGDVTLATVTTQSCIITGIVVLSNGATTADLTSIQVLGGAAKVVTFINDTDGAKANLDATDKQVAWGGGNDVVALKPTKTIIMTLTGTGSATVNLTVYISYKAVVSGGYLA